MVKGQQTGGGLHLCFLSFLTCQSLSHVLFLLVFIVVLRIANQAAATNRQR